MDVSSDFLVVLVTVGSSENAESIASTLVGERLSACVNVISPVTSYYVWQDELRRDAEVLLIIKSTVDNYPALEKRILELHTYEVPEILAIRVDDGNPDYLGWLSEMAGGR